VPNRAIAQSAALETTTLAELGTPDLFDVCIIGSGPAGAILAKHLVDAGIETIVLESGPAPGVSDPRFTRLDVYSTSGNPYALRESRYRGLGGTSNLWTGGCCRLDPTDLAADNGYAPTGAPWPLSYEELSPFYVRAETELSVRGAPGSSFAPPRQVQLPLQLPPGGRTTSLERILAPAELTLDSLPNSDFDGEPLRTAKTHLPAFSQSPHGTLAVGCTVTRIIADSKNEVSGLQVKGLGGLERTVRARFYVVASGVVETCRLLLLSQAGFRKGTGIGSDLVGRYFMTQYHQPRAKGVTPPSVPRGHGVLVSRQFVPDARKRGLGAIQLRAFQMGRSIYFTFDQEVEPTRSNRITLNPKRKDYFGNPGAHLHLDISNRDRATERHVDELVRTLVPKLNLSGVLYDQGFRQSGHHHFGGCRMGRDPRTSVVDPDLRVHGTPNLYVAGAAPFVTCGIAFPTLTIAALSVRLADHLRAEIAPTAAPTGPRLPPA
jgi:choline dehydrogenase-like flavoprotein